MTPLRVSARRLAGDIVFGEGLRWRDGHVWMSDMLGRSVYKFDEQGKRDLVATVPGKPNGLGFLPDGSLLIGSMDDGQLWRLGADGRLTVHADMSRHMTGYVGDIAVDHVGRVYVDDVGWRIFEGAPYAHGRLLLVQPDGSVSVQEESLSFPNGMWITPDRQRLVFAEGRVGRMFSYGFGPQGELRDKRLLFELPGKALDGLTLDRDGAIWACVPHDKRVIRWFEGHITHELVLEHIKPVSVCLGGADQRTLYVVAADFTLERMAINDCYAELHAARVEVPGFPLPG